MDISIVVPLYNEADSLSELCEWIDRVVKGMDKRYEIIMVDDGSTDSSWETIQTLITSYPIHAIQFSRNYGKVLRCM